MNAEMDNTHANPVNERTAEDHLHIEYQDQNSEYADQFMAGLIFSHDEIKKIAAKVGG